MTVLYEEDLMPTGKYKGQQVQWVLENDPKHLKNFNNNKFALSDEVMKQVGGFRTSQTRNKMSYITRDKFTDNKQNARTK